MSAEEQGWIERLVQVLVSIFEAWSKREVEREQARTEVADQVEDDLATVDGK